MKPGATGPLLECCCTFQPTPGQTSPLLSVKLPDSITIPRRVMQVPSRPLSAIFIVRLTREPLLLQLVTCLLIVMWMLTLLDFMVVILITPRQAQSRAQVTSSFLEVVPLFGSPSYRQRSHCPLWNLNTLLSASACALCFQSVTFSLKLLVL